MQGTGQIRYISALAFRLAQRNSRSALEIAQQVQRVLTLAQPSEPSILAASVQPPVQLTALWHHFTIEAIAPGWLQFHLSDPGVGLWLQSIIDGPKDSSNQAVDETHRHPGCSVEQSSLNGSDKNLIFAWQYTHARCCSLLNLGMREGLIELTWNGAIGTLATPQPLPWLTPEQRMRCQHPAELRLITQIQTLLDQWIDPPHDPALQPKLLHSLCQDFEGFHRQCRLFNEVKRDDRALAQVRLGLVLITQSLLRAALNELQLDAPTAL